MADIFTIADGNWMLWRAFSTAGQQSSVPTKRIPLQILDWFCSYSLRLQATHGAIAFDGNKNFRLELYPNYKGSRSGSEGSHAEVVKQGALQGMTVSDAVYSCLGPTIELFESVGIKTVQEDKYEADDCLSSAAHKFGVRSNHVYLITRDKDMVQCINERVSLYTPPMQMKPEIIYTVASTPELKKGLTPKQFLDYQILMGDGMDDVPAVAAMTEKRALAILKSHGSLSAYFKTLEGKEFYSLRASELHRNKDLVGLSKKAFNVSSAKELSFKHLNGSAQSKAFTTLRDLQRKTSLF